MCWCVLAWRLHPCYVLQWVDREYYAQLSTRRMQGTLQSLLIVLNSFMMNKRKSALCRGISCYLLVNQVQNICPSYLLCFSFPSLHSITRFESSLRENEFGFAKGLFLHYTRFVTKSNRKFIIISLCFCRECLYSSVELV